MKAVILKEVGAPDNLVLADVTLDHNNLLIAIFLITYTTWGSKAHGTAWSSHKEYPCKSELITK